MLMVLGHFDKSGISWIFFLAWNRWEYQSIFRSHFVLAGTLYIFLFTQGLLDTVSLQVRSYNHGTISHNVAAWKPTSTFIPLSQF